MQIPAQPATAADAAQIRRDVMPTAPTAAVAGVAEEAQRLDSRAALRWAQPVLKSEAGQLMRDSAASALAPAGAAAYPQLSALASLIGPLMARADAQMTEGIVPPWPDPGSPDTEISQAALPPRSMVQQALDKLMSSLANSEAFAASRLIRTWWLEPEPQTPSQEHLAQQARWVAALAPGSEGAQQALRLLLTGQMVWEGQLLPDLPAQIQRQDAWRGGHGQAQPLEKGAALNVQVELPGLGQLRVAGQQWGQALHLQLQLPAGQEGRLRERWAQLQKRLDDLGVGQVTLQEMTAQAQAKEAPDEP